MFIRSIILILFISVHLISADLHVMGCHGAGFFSNFLKVISHLHYCELTNKTPFVYWGNDSYYYDTNGWNNEKNNVWEYYFEQLSEGTNWQNYPIDGNYQAPDGFIILNAPNFRPEMSSLHRILGRQLIEKYIRLKPQVELKVQTFIKQNLENKYTIAIHFRGTDKWNEVRPVNFYHVIDLANRKAQEHIGAQFFVASDQQSFIEFAQQNLRGKVLFYDAFRARDHHAIHHRKPSMAEIGEQGLIDMILLANCNFLIRTPSNLSSTSLLWNPNLPDQLITGRSVPELIND